MNWISRPTIFICLIVCSLLACKTDDKKGTLLSNVNIVDVEEDRIINSQDVLIVGNLISEITEHKNNDFNPESEIPGDGKYLIPGLWDMHVHTGDKNIFLPLYIANGITGIRDTGGNMEKSTGNLSIEIEQINLWREEINSGKLLGPRIYAAGPMIDGKVPIWPRNLEVNSVETAIEAVREVQKRRADFVKVYIKLKKEHYQAVIDEANRLGLPVAGHLPDAISISEAINAGQKSIEHFGAGLFLIYCSTEEERLKRELDEIMSSNLPAFERVKERIRIFAEAADTYDDEKASSITDLLVNGDTWLVPTLIEMEIMFKIRTDFDEDLSYLPPFIRENWTNHPFLAEYPVEYLQYAHDSFKKQMEIIRKMKDAGVKFLAGSDSANPFVMPGFALHDELDLLVRVGFTPVEALRAATINPAIFFNIADSLGTVQKGKIADLILLEANPLEEIANTREISGVFVNGSLIDEDSIENLLQTVRKTAERK